MRHTGRNREAGPVVAVVMLVGLHKVAVAAVVPDNPVKDCTAVDIEDTKVMAHSGTCLYMAVEWVEQVVQYRQSPAVCLSLEWFVWIVSCCESSWRLSWQRHQ